jgi:glycosyltransferase involved in cell wall biosynthesis
MKQKMPLVSVVMPVYNAGSFLREAIESILNQTYSNFELIVVNDASTDNSGKIIREYTKMYPRKIRAVHLRTNINGGGDAAGNIGFKMARGVYVARMDADDIADTRRLQMQVTYMQNHLNIDLLGTCATVINGKGEVTGEKVVPLTHKDIYREFFTFHPMIHPTIMIRKSSISGEVLYKQSLPSNNDYLTFYTLIAGGKQFANLSDKLLSYRLHGKNDSLHSLKRNFINSLRTRWIGVTQLCYRPSLLAVLKLLAQCLVVFMLPERLAVEIYLLARGIRKWSDYRLVNSAIIVGNEASIK